MLFLMKGDTAFDMITPYLLLVSIGPVQSFIASARRTRDLAFGSKLLSELSKAVAAEIVERSGTLDSLIFPAPLPKTFKEDLEENSDFSVANKIVAIIEPKSDDPNDDLLPEKLTGFLKERLDARLEGIRENAFKEFNSNRLNGGLVTAKDQVKALPEFSWVALPYNKTDYESQRHLLEAMMAARSNTRVFQAVSWGGTIPKSSIDGVLESVIPEESYPTRRKTKDCNQTILDKTQALYENFKVGPHERLSGVDLLKRHDKSILKPEDPKEKPSYPSTSHMASLPFLKRLESLPENVQKDLNTTLKECITKFENIQVNNTTLTIKMEKIPKEFSKHPVFENYDGSLLFEERINNLLYIPHTSQQTEWQRPALNALQNFISSLHEELKNAGFSPASPQPYYALLQADGDGMGKAIDNIKNLVGHRKISQALSEFSKSVRKIVETTHEGALIYAGGDDVMALLPLHTVLACAQELSKKFRKTLKDFDYEEEKDDNTKEKKTPTLSVGIAIVHHLELLRDARVLAHEAEKLAKNVDGKDALAIILSKRSGETYQMKGKWDEIDKDLEQFTTYTQEGKIPSGTAYELRSVTLPLMPLTNEDEDENTNTTRQPSHSSGLQDAIKQEALRIFHRKLFVPRNKFPRDEAKAVEDFLKLCLGIHELDQPANPSIKRKTIPIKDLIDELIIAQMLAEAKSIANPKKEEKHNAHLAN
jgi:CRISPR-associated protein Cmr2